MIISYFRNEWIVQIDKYQRQRIPSETVKEHTTWFEYLFNPNNPQQSTYRCRLCNKYYDMYNLPKRYKNAFAYDKGTLKETKNDNKRAIKEHANMPGHQHIIQILQQSSAKRFENLLWNYNHGYYVLSIH